MVNESGLLSALQDDESGGDTSSAVKGTLPYMAPEYLQGGYRCLSPKCDVYSFGVVVLELLTGRPVTARFERGGNDIPLVEYAASLVREQKALEMIDAAVWDAFDVSEAQGRIRVALECLHRDPHSVRRWSRSASGCGRAVRYTGGMYRAMKARTMC